MTDHASTQKLISTIERTDRLFRGAQIAFMVILVFSLIGIIIIQIRTLDAVKHQLDQQKQTVAEIKRDNSEQLGRLNRHLDCIVAYFGQTNRGDLTIENINECTLENHAGAQQFFNQPITGPQQGPNGALTPSATQSTPQSRAAQGSPVASGPSVTPKPTPTPTTPPTSQPSVVQRIINLVTGLLR